MKWKYISEGGEKRIGGVNVYIKTHNSIEPLEHRERHSPTGFQFGYNGSGPSDLARSILIDFFIRKDDVTIGEASLKAEDLYQKFKFDIISKQNKTLKVTNEEIEEWLESI
ncbi:MAG: DUF6166 domain-containing protein [bacterium]